jgi:hypothetical protein
MHATTGLSWSDRFGNITSFAYSTAHRVLNQVRVINQVNPTAVINCADLVRHVDCMQRQDRACSIEFADSSWRVKFLAAEHAKEILALCAHSLANKYEAEGLQIAYMDENNLPV